MPKGMTPKDRKNVKNKKSIRKVATTLAGTMGMGAGKIKDAMKLGKAAKMASKVASGMGAMGMDPVKVKNLLKEAKMRKPSGRINMDDLFNADKYKMKMPQRAPMQKGPLGPLRPITERSQSKLTSRRRGMAEDFKRSRLGRPKGTRAK